ncbi:MAG TPA: rhomboid family intramembrane serine protease [Streptosporangiaceae bacterium]|nr:rhomboid family intramembrane serine protease [Streptosporangiaceae bacterium]
MPATGGSPAKGRARSSWLSTWQLGDDEPHTLLSNARRAFFVMLGVLALLWIIQIVNFGDGYHLTLNYGIRPRDVGSLPYILTAPFLHFSWSHIEGNSGPLFIFGFLAAYRGIGKFVAVTVIVVLTSGFAAWIFESPHSVGAGASGVVFGYFGYIMVRGLFDRRIIDLLIGAVMALCFAYQFSVLLPHQGIGWQAHVGGLVGGVASGYLLRDWRAARSAAKVRTAAGTSPGTVVLPANKNTAALPKRQSGKTGKPSTVDPANPRADLYKELDDLGL